MLFGLPPLGLVLSGKPLPPHLTHWPIPTQPGEAFLSWPVLGLLAVIIFGTLAPFLWRLGRSHPSGSARHASFIRFPWWGWIAVASTVLVWFLAWTRFSWWQPWQPYTFPLLWFGFIVIINAFTYFRTGRCMLIKEPAFLMKLFILSAGFWWTFEYLNQFVQNWHYVRMEKVPSVTTIFWMTLSFSTVLPAVLGTYEFLSAWNQVKAPFENWHGLSAVDSSYTGWLLFSLGSLGLLLIGIWPSVLFPLLWLCPLLVMLGISILQGNITILTPLARGNWSPVVLSALAALICGGFWEMWNAYSLVHWEYSIPYVQGVKIFEMPILGYAGYLPFGLSCLAVVDFFLGSRKRHSWAEAGELYSPPISQLAEG